MTEKYKLETWKRKHKREYKNDKIGITKKGEKFFYSEKQRLVLRDSKGHFKKVLQVREKSYGTGSYMVGLNKQGKIVTRKKIGERTPQWYDRRKEVINNRQILRCAIVLNDIPFRGNEYYGFRIVVFSHSKQILQTIYPKKMKEKLIKFIEDCIGYRYDEFWFDMYFGYEQPTPSNAYKSDDNTYYLLWTKRSGAEMKRKMGNINEL